jgi:hypothetical protein
MLDILVALPLVPAAQVMLAQVGLASQQSLVVHVPEGQLATAGFALREYLEGHRNGGLKQDGRESGTVEQQSRGLQLALIQIWSSCWGIGYVLLGQR